jgi:hypothetical protein
MLNFLHPGGDIRPLLFHETVERADLDIAGGH